MATVYILFAKFKWKPSDYYSMSHGEKVVTKAFLLKYSEDMDALEAEMESYGK